MPTTFQGFIDGKGLKFALILPRFNDFVGTKLLDGAVDALSRNGVLDKDIHIFRVPGSFEIPYIAKQLVNKNIYNAIICLGAIIRGDTPHFEYLSAEVTKGVAQVALNSPIPVIFGVLTCDTIEQAIERSGTKGGNKGYDAAIGAIEMTNLNKEISKPIHD
jgi:6,7-dimethyl-8-ribityllumazine synthase